MPISFPSNPSVGNTYDFGGIHYIYNGDGWVNKSIYGISAGSGISFANYNGTGPLVISASSTGVELVSSFNGKTGAVQGVSSINGNTGAITNVAFTNTAQSFSGLQQFTQGISGSGGVTFYFPSGNTSIRFVSTATRYIEITPGLQNSMVGYGSGGFKFKANAGQLSLASVNVAAIGDVDGDNQQTVLYVDDDSGIISFSFVGGQYTFPNTDGSANDVLTTDGAGQISWVGNVAKTNIAQSFTGLQQFPGGMSASGATFSSNVNINAKTILGSTVLGSATPGCIEFDGNNLYAGTTGGRGLIEAPHISYASSLVSLSGITNYQNIFSASSDVITLAANTSYIVEGHIVVQSGTTTHTTALRLTDSVVANSPIFRLHILSTAAAAGSITRAQDTVYFETNGGVINSTSTSARVFILLRGAIETVDSVTITPQIAFSANPGGTNQIQEGSWIKFTPVGTNTVTSIGPWA